MGKHLLGHVDRILPVAVGLRGPELGSHLDGAHVAKTVGPVGVHGRRDDHVEAASPQPRLEAPRHLPVVGVVGDIRTRRTTLDLVHDARLEENLSSLIGVDDRSPEHCRLTDLHGAFIHCLSPGVRFSLLHCIEGKYSSYFI